ncbi:MBL fold metallo-hydrolase [Pelomonas sp. KK5]|uniref:MBL fold metallo-hydrolase n=1 Tax=Pelomonas sp. KK5 TaxID=1855730 RepID=UPI00097BD38A|nr:MBL fold metallo-hydrolase [Pelomonas sp. KK5]
MRSLILLILALLTGSLANAVPERIADGVVLLRDSFEPGSQPDGNSLLLQGPQGWVLFDAGRHGPHTQALLDFTKGELRAVINSHWHLDHLGGNVLLRGGQPGLVVYASAAVDKALSGWLADYRRQLQGYLKDEQIPEAAKTQMRVDLALLDEPQALAPDMHITGPQALTLAGRELRVGLETAVSGGDVWLLDTATGTLASGDLVTLPVPFMDTACPDEWSAALGRLEAVPFQRLVPGHGPVMDAADLRRYREAFDGLLACAAGSRPEADCTSAWAAALGGLIAEADRARVPAMLDYYFKSRLRSPQRDKFCTAAR